MAFPKTFFSILILFPLLVFPGACKSAEDPTLYKISLSDLEGSTHTFANDKGKIVILDFWASWCEPCKKAVPVVDALKNELKNSDAVVFGVNTEDDLSPEEIRKAAKEFGMEYPILLDPEWKLVNTLKLEGQPALFVFSKSGKKIHFQYGISDQDLPILKGRIKNWLESP